MQLALAAAISLFIGLSLGLLGGGGSILTVPILVYVLEVPAKQAIATSFMVVGLTSFFAMLQHARKGTVRWRTGLTFGGAAMTLAYVSGRVAKFLPGKLLLVLFAIVMVVTSITLLKGRKGLEECSKEERHQPPVLRVLLQGAAVGAVTGLIGAGGGFLIVPALVLLTGLTMHEAIATSLLIISLNSLTGFAGYLTHVSVPWKLASVVSSAAVVGSFGGSALAHRISAERLRKAFAVFILLMAAFMLYRELVLSPK